MSDVKKLFASLLVGSIIAVGLIATTIYFSGSPMLAGAINVSVPSPASTGQMLVSSTTAWIATTTDPAHFGSIYATSTATSTLPNISGTGGLSYVYLCLTGDTCRTTWPSASVSGGSAGMMTSWTNSTTLTSTSTIVGASMQATSTTVASNFILASTTNQTIATALWIPNGTAPSPLGSGSLALNTTTASTSLRFYDGTAVRVLFTEQARSINLASSTLSYQSSSYGASGSTTILVMNNDRPMTLIHFYCKTDANRVHVDFSTGSTHTTDLWCSPSGIDSGALASNNTFTIYQDFKINVGTATTSPNNTVITYFLRNDAD